MTHRDTVVLAGYVVRCPLGGYAWQVLHYLAGLRALGFDPYFYEDTAYYHECFDPISGTLGTDPGAGVAFAADFFGHFGFDDRWVFWDAARNRHHGLTAAETAALLHDARLVITLAAVNRVPRRPRQRKIFIDIDPAYTQIRVAEGDAGLCEFLAEHDLHYTIGENIGTASCAIPTERFAWRRTRQPIALELWPPLPGDAAAAFTTIGRWDERRREIHFRGELYSWRKRVEWLKFLDLPKRTGERFVMAMDVASTPGDEALLRGHGWEITDPIAVSADALTYRDFIRRSKGEFTVAKDLNVRLASGWFSDRSACYLAAGRPVLAQETGFSAVMPTGRGVLSYSTLEEAVDAVRELDMNYALHCETARAIAGEYFAAEKVLGKLLRDAGL